MRQFILLLDGKRATNEILCMSTALNTVRTLNKGLETKRYSLKEITK